MGTSVVYFLDVSHHPELEYAIKILVHREISNLMPIRYHIDALSEGEKCMRHRQKCIFKSPPRNWRTEGSKIVDGMSRCGVLKGQVTGTESYCYYV